MRRTNSPRDIFIRYAHYFQLNLDEANWPRLKEALVKSRDPSFIGQWYVACLDLGIDQVPRQTIFNVLRSIGRKPITYENVFPDKKMSLLSNSQVNYV